MNGRRKVGGYAWDDELDGIKGMSEEVTRGLTELSKHARTVEVSNLITRLVASSSAIAVKAMELRGYKA